MCLHVLVCYVCLRCLAECSVHCEIDEIHNDVYSRVALEAVWVLYVCVGVCV